MSKPMPVETAQELVDLAQAGMPREICGLVLVGWELMPLKNVSNSPHRSFALDPEVHLEMFLTRRPEIVGIYHSHPSLRNYPSDTDCTTMTLYPGMRHWIATCSDVYEWRMDNDVPRPVRVDGKTGAEGMAYPVLAAAEALRRASRWSAA